MLRSLGLPGRILVCAALLLASPAAAEITVTSARGSGEVDVRFDLDGDGQISLDEQDFESFDAEIVSSFQETAQTSVSSSRGLVTLTSTLTAGAERVIATARGSCDSAAPPPGSDDAIVTDISQTRGRFDLRLRLTQRTRVTLGGAISASGNQQRVQGGRSSQSTASLFFDANPDSGSDPVQFGHEANVGGESFSEEAVLEPGSVGFVATCGTGAGGFESFPLGRARFDVTLVLETEAPSDVFRWVGGRTGDFDTAENWDPPGVPTFVDGERSDTALFDGRGRAGVDFAPSLAAAARGPAAPRGPLRREIGRLRVERGTLVPEQTTLTLRDASSADPSLIVGDSGTLFLGAGADVLAQQVSIARGGELALEDVLLFDCTELNLAQGSVSLRGGLLHCPRVRSLDATLDLEGAGSVLLAEVLVLVGGGLRVAGGASLETLAAVLEKLPGSSAQDVVVGDALPDSGTWRADNLFVDDVAVNVRRGGLLEVSVLELKGAAGLVFVDGGRLAASGGVVVSDGVLDLLGVASIAGPLEIQGGEVLLAHGLGAGEQQSTSESALVTGGRLLVTAGGALETAQSAVVSGTLDSRPALAEIGRAQDAGTANRWTVLGTLAVGAADALTGVGTLRLFDSLVEAGTGVIAETGHVEGQGTLFVRSTPPFTGDGIVHNRGTIDSGILIDGILANEGAGRIVVTQSGAGGAPQLNPLSAALGRALRARTGAPPPPETPLVVTGDASLDGTLVLQFRNGFAPAQGQPFRVLEAGGTATGAFAQMEAQGLAPGALFDAAFQNGAFTVVATTPTEGLPPLTLKAKTKLKESKKKGAKLKVGRTGDRSQPLLVRYRTGGSAENGLDYERLEGVLEIPAGKKSATIVVRPFRDGVAELPETVEIEILPGDGYSLPLVSRATLELLSSE
jgi:hypothetical protein